MPRCGLELVERRADLPHGLVGTVLVEPRIATTPIVFSSQSLTASSAESVKRLPSIGTSRIAEETRRGKKIEIVALKLELQRPQVRQNTRGREYQEPIARRSSRTRVS